MFFIFPPNIQAGIVSGVYEVVKNSAGVAIGIARNKATGQFVAHAIGLTADSFIIIPQFAIDVVKIGVEAAQMVQIHQGFQKNYKMLTNLQNSVNALTNSLGVLQATTAVMGVFSVAGAVLSAVNLYQTLKLRQDVQELRLTVAKGFIAALEEIQGVPDKVEFNHHRTILMMAYGKFLQATQQMTLAMLIEDTNGRQIILGGVQTLLNEALVAYKQPELFKDTCAAAQLRRMECAWVIEQAQAFNYQLLNAPKAASQSISHLQNQIRSDSLKVIERCKSEDEMDFLFPEIARIHTQDLPVLEAWQNQLDWMHALSSDEQQQLASLPISSPEDSQTLTAQPVEISEYEKLKQKSHFDSLRDQLYFLVNPDLRLNHEAYIRQQATISGQKGLAFSHWQEVSDLTIANLYHYFKVRE